MRNMRLFLLMTSVLAISSVLMAADSAVKIDIGNPTEDAWEGAPVVVSWSKAFQTLGDGPLAVVDADGKESFVQRDDLDGDGNTDEIVFLVKLPPKTTKTVRIVKAASAEKPVSRAHAGMYLRGLVGPAWESDMIAYRIYWNTDSGLIDVFGKISPMLSVKAFATGGFDYHVQSKYGMDVLKVGQSLGAGGFGVFIDGQIWKLNDVMKTHFVRADGPLRAVLDCEFIDWYTGPGVKKAKEEGPGLQRRFDLYARFSIIAGQKWGDVQLLLKPVDHGPMPEIVTGVIKQEGTQHVLSKEHGILGRWGRQALGDHEVPKSGDLGLGVIVNPMDVVTYGEDEYNNYIRLKTTDGKVGYRYLSSWYKEPGGARSTQDYEALLRAAARLKPEVKVQTAD